MSRQITSRAVSQWEELLVWFVWEMLPPPMLEMGPCLAVPHSDLLRMVPISGMAFSAQSTPSTGNCFSFFGFLVRLFFVFKEELNSSSAARHWLNVPYGGTTCTRVSRTKSWDLIHCTVHPEPCHHFKWLQGISWIAFQITHLIWLILAYLLI